MADREKVIKAIEICYTLGHNCTECTFFSEDNCNDKLMCDVLTLLKEQEAVEPTIDKYGNKRCGSCGHKLQSIADPDLFCCKCGKPVLWEGR